MTREEPMRRFCHAVVLLAISLACSARPAAPGPCDDLDDNWGQQHFGDSNSEEAQVDLPPIERPAGRGTLSIRPGENGAVTVRSWDQDRVLVCARVFAADRDRDAALGLARRVRVEAEGREIRATGPTDAADARWAVSLTVFVPRRTDLSVVTVNGPIRMDGVHGKIELQTTNGPIEVKRAGGDVRGRTTNGPVRVLLDGKRWDGAGLDVETVNGPATISLPEDYSAEIVTGTENGPVSSPWPLPKGRNHYTIRTNLGEGGATIRVVTRNGPVRIERI